ncbi:Transcriptional regulatory protein DegU [subsurface metagenome]
MDPVKVLVVDDHTLFRRGITDILANEESLEVVGEGADGLEAIKKAKELAPDVILMDLNMPRCSGLDAIQALQAEMPQVNILVLTVSEMESDLFDAIKFGATGYLLKKAEPDELVYAILYVARGGAIISPLMATKLLTEFKFQGLMRESIEADTDLTSREVEVLQLVAQGVNNKQIGDSLFISENTVRTHIRHIMGKLHLANRTQAAAYALKKGLIEASS